MRGVGRDESAGLKEEQSITYGVNLGTWHKAHDLVGGTLQGCQKNHTFFSSKLCRNPVDPYIK